MKDLSTLSIMHGMFLQAEPAWGLACTNVLQLVVFIITTARVISGLLCIVFLCIYLIVFDMSLSGIRADKSVLIESVMATHEDPSNQRLRGS